MNALAPRLLDRHLLVTDRIMQTAGIPNDGDHTILRENVATLLTQMKDEFVDGLPEALQSKGIEGLNGSFAAASRVDFGLKLSRDVRQRPYTDQAVMDRVAHLERDLSSTVQDIVDGSAGYPCKFYVAGSVLRGRFGAESDVDLLVEASPEWMQAHRFDRSDDVSIQYIDCAEKDKPAFVEAFAPAVPMTATELCRPHVLLDLFKSGYERKGYQVEGGHLVPVADRISREVETPSAAAGRVMWSLPMV